MKRKLIVVCFLAKSLIYGLSYSDGEDVVKYEVDVKSSFGCDYILLSSEFYPRSGLKYVYVLSKMPENFPGKSIAALEEIEEYKDLFESKKNRILREIPYLHFNVSGVVFGEAQNNLFAYKYSVLDSTMGVLLYIEVPIVGGMEGPSEEDATRLLLKMHERER